MSTLEYIENKVEIYLSGYFNKKTEVTIKKVGQLLCGSNWKLAKNPTSKEFLENVAYNSPDSMILILWLQLKALE